MSFCSLVLAEYGANNGLSVNKLHNTGSCARSFSIEPVV